MKVSLVTVVYNNIKGLKKTVNSVLVQKNVEFEYIIVDGASTDGTIEYLNELSNNIPDNISFKYISEKDTGIYNAMNKGAKLATGEYIQYLNAEDTLISDNIIADVSKKIDGTYDVYHGDIVVDYGEVKYIAPRYELEKFSDLMVNKHPATFVRSTLMKEIKFDEDYRSAADYKFFLYLYINKYKFKRIDVLIANFVAGGYSSTNDYLALKEKFTLQEVLLGVNKHTFKCRLQLLKAKFLEFIKKHISKKLVSCQRIKSAKKRIKKYSLKQISSSEMSEIIGVQE